MLIQVLVKDQIEGGTLVLDALREEGFPISGAFWCRMPDRDYWKLIIASEFIKQFGPLSAYGRVRDILAKRHGVGIAASDIVLFSPTDPEYVRLRKYALGPGRFGIGPGAGGPRNTSFEEAWLYF